jgi:hypothetical protein
MITPPELAFIKESNRIEGIHRNPTEAEIEEYQRFMAQDEITLRDIVQFVSVYQPDAELRDKPGMNVTVGGYHPPRGDITVRTRPMDILADAVGGDPYAIHLRYERLHPLHGRQRAVWPHALDVDDAGSAAWFPSHILFNDPTQG